MRLLPWVKTTLLVTIMIVMRSGLASGETVIDISGQWNYVYTGDFTDCLNSDCGTEHWNFSGSQAIWQSGSSVGWLGASSGCPFSGTIEGKRMRVSGPFHCPSGVRWTQDEYTAEGWLSDDYNTITVTGSGYAIGSFSSLYGHWYVSDTLFDETVFTPANPYLSLLISPTPTNGRITGVGIDCGTAGGGDCVEPFPNGTTVTLTAEPAPGCQLGVWSGCPSSSGATCSVLMTQARSVSVSFIPLPALAAAVLPVSRSVLVGVPASAFATIINAMNSQATGCGISPATVLPATFAFQITDPLTNRLTGIANTPVDIPVGGYQSFVFALTPSEPIAPTEVRLNFSCENASPAPILSGINTLFLSASSVPTADVIAMAATIGNTGIVTIPGATGT